MQRHFPRTLRAILFRREPRHQQSDARSRELGRRSRRSSSRKHPQPAANADKFNLNRFVTTAAQNRGRAVFFGPGKCSFCHGGTGLATMTVPVVARPSGPTADSTQESCSRDRPGTDNLPCEPSVGAVRDPRIQRAVALQRRQ